MPDVYISRAGMESKHLDEKFTQTELGALKDDYVKMEQANRIDKERIRQLEDSMRNLHELVAKAMQLNPSVAETKAALKQKSANLPKTTAMQLKN